MVQMVVLQASNDPTITISRKAAEMSNLIKDMLIDDEDDELPVIPLMEVSQPILEKVVKFLTYHEENPIQVIQKPIQTTILKDIVGDWDAAFVDLENDQETLFNLILAANYLDIPSLLELGLCKLACMVKGKEPDEIKKIFNIEEDITHEAEKLVREQNQWIFEISKD